MKFLTYIGYLFIGVLAVIFGNILYSVLSVKVYEKMGQQGALPTPNDEQGGH